MTPERPAEAIDAPLTWMELAQQLSDRIADLVAERDRLREALEEARVWCEGSRKGYCRICQWPLDTEHGRSCFVPVLRAALSPTPEPRGHVHNSGCKRAGRSGCEA